MRIFVEIGMHAGFFADGDETKQKVFVAVGAQGDQAQLGIVLDEGEDLGDHVDQVDIVAAAQQRHHLCVKFLCHLFLDLMHEIIDVPIMCVKSAAVDAGALTQLPHGDALQRFFF